MSEQLRLSFEPLQLHLQASDLLEQFRLLGQPLFLALALLAPREQFASAVEKLPLPLAHLDRVAPRGALPNAVR